MELGVKNISSKFSNLSLSEKKHEKVNSYFLIWFNSDVFKWYISLHK